MGKESYVHSGERLDDLQCNGYYLIQDPDWFCFGVDAVLLSHYAKVKDGDKVLDICSGNGIIPILLSGITDGMHFTGLEIQEHNVDMARRSIALNHIEDKVNMVLGDVKEAVGIFEAASFQVVTANPPYMIGQHGLTNACEHKMIARHEVLCTLEDVVAAASKLLVPGGRFYMVHKPFRLPEIIAVMREYHIEPKGMRLVHPYVDKEPNMVLIEGVRGGRPRMKVEPPLIIYTEKGMYTEEVLRVYGKNG